jgi:1-aminocyclopropane-1-carboxylate deaminase/D-cysteine desulfhydrase-like pyridoxal-dependent ACC family enzyme
MTTRELRARINKLPRVKLTELPTPFHELKRLGRELGGPRLFMKRDDLTGLAFGGNKTRMFEFLLENALQKGADCIIGGAAVQSNYARQLAAACAVLGLECHLVLRRIRGKVDDQVQGNMLLDLLAGARVHVIDTDPAGQSDAMYTLAKTLEGQGKHPVVVRMANGSNLTPDVAAYVECFCEIMEQSEALGIRPTHIYTASYDSTQAGLELANQALGAGIAVVGITPADWGIDIAAGITRYANQAAENLGLSCRVDREHVTNIKEYIGSSYGIPTEEGLHMLKRTAELEGIFLDPVYTGKAMAALADHVRTGKLTGEDTVVFLHTGGNSVLFAYANELSVLNLKVNLHIH